MVGGGRVGGPWRRLRPGGHGAGLSAVGMVQASAVGHFAGGGGTISAGGGGHFAGAIVLPAIASQNTKGAHFCAGTRNHFRHGDHFPGTHGGFLFLEVPLGYGEIPISYDYPYYGYNDLQ